MMKGVLWYSIPLLILCFVVVTIIRLLVPQDHSYGSIAVIVLAFLYPSFVKADVYKVIWFGMAYTAVLLFDSVFQVFNITSVKSSEALVFPILAGIAIMFVNLLGMSFEKLISKFRAVKNSE